jgi:6-phosphogluconolactonase (cycloisomerase 2 family)
MLLMLALLFTVQGTSSAQGTKSLYVNADLNGNSPIRAYAIQPPSTYLTHQATSNTTGYGGVGLAIDTDSKTLFVTFEFSGILKMVDATTLHVPATGVTAPGASNLAGIVVDQELSRVYTIDRHTDNLYVYNWMRPPRP